MDISSNCHWVGVAEDGGGHLREARVDSLAFEVLSNPKSRLVMGTGGEGHRTEPMVKVLETSLLESSYSCWGLAWLKSAGLSSEFGRGPPGAPFRVKIEIAS